MLNAFFADTDNFPTNESCVEFAQTIMEDLMFLYLSTDSDDPKVFFFFFFFFCMGSGYSKAQEWRGLFRGPFVYQVFATHLMAIQGHKEVASLGTPAELLPRGALALSAVAVSKFAFSIACTAYFDPGGTGPKALGGWHHHNGITQAGLFERQPN